MPVVHGIMRRTSTELDGVTPAVPSRRVAPIGLLSYPIGLTSRWDYRSVVTLVSVAREPHAAFSSAPPGFAGLANVTVVV